MKRFLLVLVFLYFALPLAAQETANYKMLSTPRFTLYIEKNDSDFRSQEISENHLSKIAFTLLDQTYEEISRILKVTPEEKIVLRFVSPEEFRRKTGAPSWTNAMFFRGEIIMPFSEDTNFDIQDLGEALRHEYTHALLAEASAYRIPAWLDEGIAQMIEGKQNAILAPALRAANTKNQIISLEKLENGFIELDSQIVPAAYAQSFFAAKSLVNRYGLKEIKNYLSLLKNGAQKETAFLNAFGQTQSSFEKQLAEQIKRWAESERVEI